MRNELLCPRGCRFPVVGGIPRFVESDNYAKSFGLQWKHFARTQLDSYTGLPVSRDRLTRCFGGSLEVVRDRSVLEVGCGAGRFSEVLLDAGARLFAVDLSAAVEAAYENNRTYVDCDHYFICQANAYSLPARKESFDFVMCLGVIQHTPDPERTIAALASYVKPGGALVIDHYGPDYPMPLLRRAARAVLLKLPAGWSKPVALGLSRGLLAAHKLLWRPGRVVGRARRLLTRHSPLVDYYDSYRQLGKKLLGEWCVLDTHDTLTDVYKHLRSIEQIRSTLAANGLVDLQVTAGGNGVEARARKPVAEACTGSESGSGDSEELSRSGSVYRPGRPGG